MPLSMPYQDPTDVALLSATYVVCSEFRLNFATQSGEIAYQIHRSKASAMAGKTPLGEIRYQITPAGIPAVVGMAPQLTAPVYDGATPPTLLVPPTYGPQPVIAPAFPSFSQLMAANSEAFYEVASAIYALALSRPEFAGAVMVDQTFETPSAP